MVNFLDSILDSRMPLFQMRGRIPNSLGKSSVSLRSIPQDNVMLRWSLKLGSVQSANQVLVMRDLKYFKIFPVFQRVLPGLATVSLQFGHNQGNMFRFIRKSGPSNHTSINQSSKKISGPLCVASVSSVCSRVYLLHWMLAQTSLPGPGGPRYRWWTGWRVGQPGEVFGTGVDGWLSIGHDMDEIQVLAKQMYTIMLLGWSESESLILISGTQHVENRVLSADLGISTPFAVFHSTTCRFQPCPNFIPSKIGVEDDDPLTD